MSDAIDRAASETKDADSISPLTDLACKIYDLAEEADDRDLYGVQISYLRMAADRIEERMIDTGRITLHREVPHERD